MNRNEMIAIGLGLVAGYFLIQYLRRGEAAQTAKPNLNMQTNAAVPDWAAGDKTLTEIWQRGF